MGLPKAITIKRESREKRVLNGYTSGVILFGNFYARKEKRSEKWTATVRAGLLSLQKNNRSIGQHAKPASQMAYCIRRHRWAQIGAHNPHHPKHPARPLLIVASKKWYLAGYHGRQWKHEWNIISTKHVELQVFSQGPKNNHRCGTQHMHETRYNYVEVTLHVGGGYETN